MLNLGFNQLADLQRFARTIRTLPSLREIYTLGNPFADVRGRALPVVLCCCCGRCCLGLCGAPVEWRAVFGCCGSPSD